MQRGGRSRRGPHAGPVQLRLQRPKPNGHLFGRAASVYLTGQGLIDSRITMARWFRDRWRAFQESYDPDEVMSASTFAGTVIVGLTLVSTILILTFVPFIAREAQVRHPWIAVALTAAATFTTSVSGLNRCRGPIGVPAAFFDNLLWSAAIVFLAVTTSGGYAVAIAIIHGLAVVTYPARYYSLTFLFGVALALPASLFLLAFRPNGEITLIVSITCVLALLTSHTTGAKRQLLRRHKQLEQAFGAADKVADESMQAALATMLLSLGHFLHELRNCQTAIATNLSFLEATSNLDERAREALQDTKDVQAAEQKLVYQTIEELKRRSRPVLVTFPISEPMSHARDNAPNARICIGGSATEFVIHGNPEHLSIILHNLIRNAVQAGASQVHLDAHLEPSGHAVRLVVHDDGPGISQSRRDKLFEPFGSTTKLEGTGLGLYLCRRYVALFGGTVSVEEGPLGGAAFVIRLPGNVQRFATLVNDRSQSEPAA